MPHYHISVRINATFFEGINCKSYQGAWMLCLFHSGVFMVDVYFLCHICTASEADDVQPIVYGNSPPDHLVTYSALPCLLLVSVSRLCTTLFAT